MKKIKTLQAARKLFWIAAFLQLNIVSLGKPASVPATGQEVKVLFIGNSLTYSNSMPQLFDSLVQASGKEAYVDQATKSGKPLHELLHDQSVINKINEMQWDFVILQSDDITAFPDLYDDEIATVEGFKDIILQNNPASQIIYTMIWGLRDGVTVLELNGQYVYYSYEEYMNKIYEGTLFVADATNLMIAPVGWAWYSAVLDDPANKPLLFASDGAHPSLHGSYLMACVMNAVIFQNSDSAIEYYAGLPAEKALYYQQKAITTVFDSLERWNILPVNTGINIDNQYHRQDFEISRIYPNPMTVSAQIDFFMVKSCNVTLNICDLSGKRIKTLINKHLDKGSHAAEFTIENIPDGVYFMQLKCGNQIQSKKIAVLR